MIDLQAFDRPIAFHVAFARITGSVNAGLFLSQAYYWANRARDTDGWFYKNQSDWASETYLSRKEQETARRKLRQLGILEEKLVGVPARLYYRINHQRTLELLENDKSDCPFSAVQNVPNGQTGLSQTDKLDCPKRTNYIYTETTTEITNREINPPISPHGGEAIKTAHRENCQGEQPTDSQRGVERLEQPTATEPENLISPTSGKEGALSKREKTNAAAAAPPLEKFLQDFSLYAPARWVRAKSLTVTYRKSLMRLIGRCNGDVNLALRIFVDGLQWAAQDKFCSECDWDLCNYLSNEKPERFAQRWEQVCANKQMQYEEAMIYADRSLAEDERWERLRELRQRYGVRDERAEIMEQVLAKLRKENADG